jgi:cytochrome c-type biogenesis protein CcmH
MSNRAVGVALIASSMFFAPVALGEDNSGQAVALESTLMAPCCWNQTLDAHESDLASSLRREIHERLAHGETTSAIQADFVVRYGERIVAMRAPGTFHGWVFGVFAVAVLMGFLLVRRVLGRGTSVESQPVAGGAPDGLDERLDDELRRMT